MNCPLCGNIGELGHVCPNAADALATFRKRHPTLEEWKNSLLQTHPDELAIDIFAAKLKAKMAATRAAGRTGWNDPGECTTEDLSIGLRVCVGKGDPVDVALYCMMLEARGAKVLGIKPLAMSAEAKASLLEEIDRQMAEQPGQKDRRLTSREAGGRRMRD